MDGENIRIFSSVSAVHTERLIPFLLRQARWRRDPSTSGVIYAATDYRWVFVSECVHDPRSACAVGRVNGMTVLRASLVSVDRVRRLGDFIRCEGGVNVERVYVARRARVLSDDDLGRVVCVR